MPQYTVTAFRWTGTGYNAQYNTSYTAVIDDDDATYNGGSDGNESISINGGAFNPTSSTPYTINVSFTDVNGDPHVEPFYFFNTSGPPSGWYFVPGPGSAFTVGATLGSYQSHTSTGWAYSTVTCFANGTMIETERGPVVVESLKPGMKIALADGGTAPLRAVLHREVPAILMENNKALQPICIKAGALGQNLPHRDLWVSRQHRMLVASPICKRMFGEGEILIPAHRLCELPGIYIDTERSDLTYYHLVFDTHEVVLAEGAPSESFFPGPEALKSLTPDARQEFETLFCAKDMPSELARFEPSAKRQKRLVARHLSNNRTLLNNSYNA